MLPLPHIRTRGSAVLWLPSLLLIAALTGIVVVPVASGKPHQSAADEIAARRLYAHAVGLIASGDLLAAGDELRLLLEQFGGSEVVDDALLELAQLYMHRDENAAATVAAERLAAEFPRTAGAAAAAVLLVELRRREASTLDEVSALRDEVLRVPLLYAADVLPRLEWRAAARVVAGELALELGDNVGATGNFGLALHDAIVPEWEQRARIGLARSSLVAGDWVAAAQVLQPVAAAFAAGDPLARQAHRLMGLIHRTQIRTQGGASAWITARTVRSAGSAFDRPTGVAASWGGEVLVADEEAPLVVGLDAAGTVQWQQRSINSRGHPWFDRTGASFIPTEDGVIEAATRQRFAFSELRRGKQEPVEKIVAGARGMFGEWVLVHDKGERVSVFDRQGRFVRSLTPPGKVQITDVDVDRQGRFYLLDRRARSVLRYSGAGQALGLAARGEWKRAEALALDALGNVYVLDRDNKRVEVFDRDGQRIARLGPGLPGGVTLEEPRDLAVDASGRLFIVDRRLQSLVVLE